MLQCVIPTIKLKSAHGRFEFYGRGDRNRTCDPLHPMQVLYQAELRPDDKQYGKPRLSKTQMFFIRHIPPVQLFLSLLFGIYCNFLYVRYNFHWAYRKRLNLENVLNCHLYCLL